MKSHSKIKTLQTWLFLRSYLRQQRQKCADVHSRGIRPRSCIQMTCLQAKSSHKSTHNATNLPLCGIKVQHDHFSAMPFFLAVYKLVITNVARAFSFLPKTITKNHATPHKYSLYDNTCSPRTERSRPFGLGGCIQKIWVFTKIDQAHKNAINIRSKHRNAAKRPIHAESSLCPLLNNAHKIQKEWFWS